MTIIVSHICFLNYPSSPSSLSRRLELRYTWDLCFQTRDCQDRDRWLGFGFICFTPLARDSTQLSYTQKRTVKRTSIRCGSHYLANFHAVRLCSHVRFWVRDGHVPSLARGVSLVFVFVTMWHKLLRVVTLQVPNSQEVALFTLSLSLRHLHSRSI